MEFTHAECFLYHRVKPRTSKIRGPRNIGEGFTMVIMLAPRIILAKPRFHHHPLDKTRWFLMTE